MLFNIYTGVNAMDMENHAALDKIVTWSVTAPTIPQDQTAIDVCHSTMIDHGLGLQKMMAWNAYVSNNKASLCLAVWENFMLRFSVKDHMWWERKKQD